MTPSRSAHGQTSSAGQVEQVHHRVGDERAGDQLRRPAGRHPGSSARSAADILVSFGIHSARSSRSSARGTYGPSSDGAAPQIRASDRNVLLVATAPLRLAGPQHRPGHAAISIRIRLRSAAHLVLVRRVGGQPLAGQPAGAERHRHRDGRLLVGSGGDLQRAAADVEHRQPARRPAEPAAYGQERQPRLVLAGQHLQVDARSGLRTRSSTSLAVRRLAQRRGGERQHRLAALVLGQLGGLGDERDQPVGARTRRSCRPCPGARPAAARSCASTPAAARHRDARPPPAGGRCWIPRRVRRAAYPHATGPTDTSASESAFTSGRRGA